MKAFIEDEVFRGPGYHLDLLALFQLALRGKHLIEVDEEGPAFQAWLARRGEDDREECRSVIAFSLEQESLRPSRTRVAIAATPGSDWEAEVPRLTLTDALHLLRRPFRVLLEDSTADRQFLLCMASEQQRSFLEDAVEIGALQFDHGGGLGSMKRQIQSAVSADLAARLTHWVLFDSDALRPGMPSRAATELTKVCGQRIPHHRLQRRTIENYLTRSALRGWTYRDPARKHARAPIFEAFCRMTDAQRHHYNLKEGFVGKDGHHGDANRGEPSAGDLYDNLTEADRTALGGGFESTIASLYAERAVQEHDLRREGALAEMTSVIDDLIARIR